MATALCPILGYKKSAEIAKKSLKTGISIKDIIIEEKLLDENKIDEILNPITLTAPVYSSEFIKSKAI